MRPKTSSGTSTGTSSDAAIETLPPDSNGRSFPILQALRPHQWVKNVLIFVPVVLDHRLFDPPVVSRALLAFAVFSCAASGAYILNDLLDLEADRRHPTRRRRPFAAGTLAPSAGLALFALLLGTALLVSALTLPSAFVELLVLYMLCTSAYSLFLKRLAVLDVLLLAGFYTLRVLAGLAATGVRFSAWFFAFSMFLFLSLAFLKRYAELSRLAREAPPQRSSSFASEDSMAQTVARRGYLSSDREWLGSMGTASGYLSVLVLALYINSDEVVVLYEKPMVLWLLCPLLLYWISRMWLLAHRGRMHDDPIVATLRDPSSYGIALLIGGILIGAL